MEGCSLENGATILRGLISASTWERSRVHQEVGRGRRRQADERVGSIPGPREYPRAEWETANGPTGRSTKLSQGCHSVCNTSDCIAFNISCCYLANIPTSSDRHKSPVLLHSIVQRSSNNHLHCKCK